LLAVSIYLLRQDVARVIEARGAVDKRPVALAQASRETV
jgi:hypothetical protein